MRGSVIARGHEECIPADVDQNNAAAVQAFLASHRCDREPGSQDLDLAPLDEMLDELAKAPLVRFVVPFLRAIVAILRVHQARLDEVALMARGAAYQPIEEDEDDSDLSGATVFGIPVVLRNGRTGDDVNAFVANLPAGLDADVVVSELVNAGYVARRSS